MRYMRINLTQSKSTLINSIDLPLVEGYAWYAARVHKDKYYAVHCRRGKKPLYMHKLIAEHVYGPTPEGHCVDHINSIRTLDNRRDNLRIVPWGINSVNAINYGSLKYRGVYQSVTGRYVARDIGTFNSLEDAAIAADYIAIQKYGEYAVLNFPDNTHIDYTTVIARRRSNRLGRPVGS